MYHYYIILFGHKRYNPERYARYARRYETAAGIIYNEPVWRDGIIYEITVEFDGRITARRYM